MHEHLHCYGSRRARGSLGAQWYAEWLYEVHNRALFDWIVCDPSQGSLIATLRDDYGLPVFPANNDKHARITVLNDLLDLGRLTFSPGTPGLEEFGEYRYAQAKDYRAGSANPVETRTPAGHHADFLDALGYAVLAVMEGLPDTAPTRMRVAIR